MLIPIIVSNARHVARKGSGWVGLRYIYSGPGLTPKFVYDFFYRILIKNMVYILYILNKSITVTIR